MWTNLNKNIVSHLFLTENIYENLVFTPLHNSDIYCFVLPNIKKCHVVVDLIYSIRKLTQLIIIQILRLFVLLTFKPVVIQWDSHTVVWWRHFLYKLNEDFFFVCFFIYFYIRYYGYFCPAWSHIGNTPGIYCRRCMHPTGRHGDNPERSVELWPER